MPSLADLLQARLRGLYAAEEGQCGLLAALVGETATPEFREALEEHLGETQSQLARLEEIFESLGVAAAGEPCATMENLAQECREALASGPPSPVRDAALIAACQCIEHHEIAEYGTARAFAQQLGLTRVAERLEQTLDEESHADGRLTLVAEGNLFHGGVNARAEAEGLL